MPSTHVLMQNPTTAPARPQAPDVPRIVVQRGTDGSRTITLNPGPSSDGSIEALQSQAAALSRQVAGLEAARSNMDRILEGERERSDLSPEARSQMRIDRGNVRVQLAQAEKDLENVRAEIAAKSSVPIDRVSDGGQILVPRPVHRGPDPDFVMASVTGLAFVIAIPLTIAWARRLWRGKPAPPAVKADEIAPRLDRLEQAVDAIAIEVERISEGQRFVTKLFAERPVSGPVSASPKSEGGAAPLRAIGAGVAPVEPIVMPDRQAVRPIVTPH